MKDREVSISKVNTNNRSGRQGAGSPSSSSFFVPKKKGSLATSGHVAHTYTDVVPLNDG